MLGTDRKTVSFKNLENVPNPDTVPNRPTAVRKVPNRLTDVRTGVTRSIATDSEDPRKQPKVASDKWTLVQRKKDRARERGIETL